MDESRGLWIKYGDGFIVFQENGVDILRVCSKPALYYHAKNTFGMDLDLNKHELESVASEGSLSDKLEINDLISTLVFLDNNFPEVDTVKETCRIFSICTERIEIVNALAFSIANFSLTVHSREMGVLFLEQINKLGMLSLKKKNFLLEKLESADLAKKLTILDIITLERCIHGSMKQFVLSFNFPRIDYLSNN